MAVQTPKAKVADKAKATDIKAAIGYDPDGGSAKPTAKPYKASPAAKGVGTTPKSPAKPKAAKSVKNK